MHGFDDYGHSEWMQGLLNAVANFDGETLLNLQPASEGVHHPGYLAQAGDFTIRDIGDMGLADEREHMVLAHGIDVNVFHKDHLTVFLIEDGGADDFGSALEIALGEELEGFGYPLRGLQQPFSLGVFSEETENLLHMDGYLGRSLLVVFVYFPVCHVLQ